MIIDANLGERSSIPADPYENDRQVPVKCYLCGKQRDAHIYYNFEDENGWSNGNVICDHCAPYVKGIFKDVLIAKAGYDMDKLSCLLLEFCEDARRQVEQLKKRMSYKYALNVEIEDLFEDTFTLEEIVDKFPLDSAAFRYSYQQMIRFMEEHEGETPHTVRFFFSPTFYQGWDENLIGSRDPVGEGLLNIDNEEGIMGIAKIGNNGTTYVFGSEKAAMYFCRFNRHEPMHDFVDLMAETDR